LRQIRKTVFVTIQVACGFRNPPISVSDALARTPVDIKRGEEAVRVATNFGIQEIWTTGMVCYDKHTHPTTIAALNGYFIQKAGFQNEHVPGLNAFSESYKAMKMCKEEGITKAYVVSSDFYFKAYKKMWEACGNRFEVEVICISVSHGNIVSKQVWSFYNGPKVKIMAAIAASSGFGHWLARKVADFVARERGTIGFKLDGHTTIG
jgi:hypothetical protein